MKFLLKSVLVGLAGIQGFTLAAQSRPTLVVGIMVDQLRTDYLEDLKELLSNGGFRRLMDQGIFIKDLDYGVNGGDAARSAAIIQTGTYPSDNGITGSNSYSQASKSLVPIFLDNAYIGNFTTETYSPAALRVTTLSDEIAVENRGAGRIHSISPDAALSIVLAGHAANSAFWINDETGRWSSTTYYQNPPASLQNRNYNSPLLSRLDTMRWVPLHKGVPYPFVSNADIKDGFKYTFSRADKDVFKLYKRSPYLNDDITQAASEYVADLNLGNSEDAIDVLNIAYTLAPFPGDNNGNYRYELEDAYLRLDRNLESLFNTLDRQVGRDNVYVYLVSTGYFEEPEEDASQYRLPGGNFSVKRALSLLNAFLSAKYGNAAYVENYANGNIYFSKNVIEGKNLEMPVMARESRDFLAKMSGVSAVYTLTDLLNPVTTRQEKQGRAIDARTAGDLIMEFSPGWDIIDDSKYPPETESYKTTVYPTPAFLMGPGITATIIETPVDATAIAPTVARALHIRSPNAATSPPLTTDKK